MACEYVWWRGLVVVDLGVMRHTGTVSPASDGARQIVHDGATTNHPKDIVMDPFLGQISIIGFNTPAATRQETYYKFELTNVVVSSYG